MRIEFADGPNGRPIPLQRVRSVYWVRGGKAVRTEPDEGAGSFFVSHWETCPRAEAIKAEREAARKRPGERSGPGPDVAVSTRGER